MPESRKNGLLRLRHLLEITEASSEEMGSQRDRFSRLSSESVRPTVVAHQLFQTPAALALRVANLLPADARRILEPSAGLGRLYLAGRERCPQAAWTLIDISGDCCRELRRIGEATVRQSDFLALHQHEFEGFDAVIMNPPFKMGTDIRHIHHAVQFARVGGIIISICANGPKQQAKLRPLADQWIELPEKSFASEGTDVASAIFFLKRKF